MPHVMISRKKCTGCHMCELACSAYHEGAYRPSVARLFSECNPTTAEIKGHTCLQTGCAKCQEACPNDAIVDQADHGHAQGLLREQGEGRRLRRGLRARRRRGQVHQLRRLLRRLPDGVIHEHPEREVAFKCDLCDGEPQCIAFCQNPHVLRRRPQGRQEGQGAVAAAGRAPDDGQGSVKLPAGSDRPAGAPRSSARPSRCRRRSTGRSRSSPASAARLPRGRHACRPVSSSAAATSTLSAASARSSRTATCCASCRRSRAADGAARSLRTGRALVRSARPVLVGRLVA